ncbi:TIGR02710 family CRISPR-associated CARF protein [Clostridium sp.]|jgi:CRISPR-associated protein (TIGR02710 family)|uniref:TIGR02710 family CRISPR-associated CARF protein n=1 Tax=Clostridium sp. TaxID=1506 RepID=UPI003A185BC8
MENLLNKLKIETEIWKNMNRTTNADRIEAEKYYTNNLMPIIKKLFVKKYSLNTKCPGLILTLGTSYEPIVLSISALNPEKILILYTPRSKELLDSVQKFTDISLSKCEFEQIDEQNPLILYQKIKNVYIKWGRPNDIYVDFTGGTKSMAAGCAMAGSAINAHLVYIGSDYDSNLRKPKPGSEKLINIDDPLKVFGDFERQEAINLFNHHDYVSASKTFIELNKRVPDTKEYEILASLSKCYDCWDSLNIKEAKKHMINCLELLNRECKVNKNYILFKHIERLKKQLQMLSVLEEIHYNKSNNNNKIQNNKYMIINLYACSLRKEEAEKYEIASLMQYRILEMIEQKRLLNYGIDTSNPNFSVLEKPPYNISCESLCMKINFIRKKHLGFKPITNIKPKISLLSGYILLAALNDSLMKSKKNKLTNLVKNIDIRNKSIFAHGYEFIDKGRYTKFKNVVVEYLDTFCKIEDINKDELFNTVQFIKL